MNRSSVLGAAGRSVMEYSHRKVTRSLGRKNSRVGAGEHVLLQRPPYDSAQICSGWRREDRAQHHRPAHHNDCSFAAAFTYASGPRTPSYPSYTRTSTRGGARHD